MSVSPTNKPRSAIPDSCANYSPIEDKSKDVWNPKPAGWFCKCKNWENNRILITSSYLEDFCISCDNWLTPEGEYKNRLPEETALAFYKEDSDKFIKYFRGRTTLSKKMILKEVFKCDFVNEEVIKWLDKEESELVIEVGLSLV